MVVRLHAWDRLHVSRHKHTQPHRHTHTATTTVRPGAGQRDARRPPAGEP
jgi:hypothetical protein